ncbi:hypothetical protein JYG23_04955 [Sedimentibacter sp. zth1]|uniref:hypothetical protein n=1 Tax=Sedimentibacter sp. zth1 TaxID=2816908 RepID=UPI001A91F7AB|nr:hypothetical protein [Sedimentibacter sp. zth1]QSX06800.1 hypothetical protein JYG23_04955 [Sedimentibacter sp. zth1]
MSSDIESIIKTTLNNINSITENEKLISSTIKYENSNYLAISKLNMNFVVGGGDLEKKFRNVDTKPFAGAAYVNLSLSPQLLIYENDDEIKSINLNGVSSPVNDIASVVSNIITNIKGVKEKKCSNEKFHD